MTQPARFRPFLPASERISISRAARLTNLTIRAVRFYEERGLIVSHRNANQCRTFDTLAFERLQMIADLRAIGIGLDKIGAILDLRASQGEGKARQALLTVLKEHHDHLVGRTAELQALAARLGLTFEEDVNSKAPPVRRLDRLPTPNAV
jgi:DNA-binding transcriptional MerR regulator